MKPRLFKANSPAATRKLAGQLAKQILKSRRRKKATVLGLSGDLGSGKTAFVQGFAKYMGVKKHPISPTFLIIKGYKLPTRPPARQVTRYRFLYHIDCYRLKKPTELASLGFKEIIADPDNIVLIEWAEKIKKLLPPKTVWLEFQHGQKENERTVVWR